MTDMTEILSVFNAYAADFFQTIFHSFEAKIANAIFSFK